MCIKEIVDQLIGKFDRSESLSIKEIEALIKGIGILEEEISVLEKKVSKIRYIIKNSDIDLDENKGIEIEIPSI